MTADNQTYEPSKPKPEWMAIRVADARRLGWPELKPGDALTVAACVGTNDEITGYLVVPVAPDDLQIFFGLTEDKRA